MTFLEFLELKHYGKLEKQYVIDCANQSAEFSSKWLVHSIRSQCSALEMAIVIAANLKWNTSTLQSFEHSLNLIIGTIDFKISKEIIDTCNTANKSINCNKQDKQKQLLGSFLALTNLIEKKSNLDPSKYTCQLPAIPKIIDEILTSCEPHLKEVSLFGNEGKNSKDENIRNNSHFPTPLPNDSLALALLERLLAIATGEPIEFAEPPVILKYNVGEYYKWHFDFIYPHTKEISDHINQFGQRVKTAIFYFNDDFKGGDTEFKIPFISVPPKKGHALIFNNSLKDGSRDSSSIHRGSTVTEGNKWIMTLWFRNKSFWLRSGLL